MSVQLLDITEGSVFPLGIGPNKLVDGVPGSLTVGSPSTNAGMEPDGVASGVSFGTAKTSVVIYPDGIASGLTFGDTSTDATVLVVPGPVDPSNDFGNPVVIQKRLIFRPPTQTLGWGWYKRFEGISLIKKDGVWSEVPWPTVQETLDADIYLAGGRDHAVSTSLAAELIGEGYTISEEY